MSLVHAAKRNALANYLNFAVSTAATLVASPLLVHYLGTANFGIWKNIQRFMDFGTVADGRATQALKWLVARGMGSATDQQQRQAVGSAIIVWAVFLPITLLFGAFLVFGMPLLITGVPAGQIPLLRIVGGVLALNLLLVPLLGISDSVLVGTNQGHASILVRAGVYAASNATMVMAAWAGLGLAALAGIVLTASALSALITYVQAKRRVNWFGIERPTHNQVRRFLSFSGWVLVWSLVAKFLLSADLLLLGYLVGPASVTDYVFTSYAAQFAVSVCFMTTGAFMPGVGGLMDEGNEARFAHAVGSVREVTLFMALSLCVGVLLFNHAFVTLWVGEKRYMGHWIDVLIVIEALQLILIRSEAQLQDLSLEIGKKVVVGLVSTIIAWAVASALYWRTKEVWSIFVGVIVGRLLMSVVFPRMVSASLPRGAKTYARSTMLVCGLVGMGAAASQLLDSAFRMWTASLLKMPIFAAILIVAYFCILGKSSRQHLIAACRVRLSGANRRK